MMASKHSSAAKNEDSPSFRCLTCGHSSSHYFVHYGSKKNPNAIQMAECSVCHAVVDPYMEREWLLVIMDLILLRQEAYRHVYWNRIQESRFLSLMCAKANAFLLSWVALFFAGAVTHVAYNNDWRGTVHRAWTGNAGPIFPLAAITNLGLYTRACACVRFRSRARKEKHESSSKSTINFKLVHCAIWLPNIGAGLLGMIIVGVWAPSTQKHDPHHELSLYGWSIAENIGLLVLITMWQISGLRVVLDAAT